MLDSMRQYRRHTLNEGKLYESGARMEKSPRKTVTQLVQQLGISTIWHEILQNCCICIHIRKL